MCALDSPQPWPCAGGESALLDLCHAFDDRPVLTGGATNSDWPPLHVSVAPASHRSRLGVEFTSKDGMRTLCKGLAGRGLLRRLKLVPGAARGSVCTACPVPSPSPRAANHNFFLCTLTHQHAHVLLRLSSFRLSQRLQFFQHQLNHALKTAIAHIVRLIN